VRAWVCTTLDHTPSRLQVVAMFTDRTSNVMQDSEWGGWPSDRPAGTRKAIQLLMAIPVAC